MSARFYLSAWRRRWPAHLCTNRLLHPPGKENSIATSTRPHHSTYGFALQSTPTLLRSSVTTEPHATIESHPQSSKDEKGVKAADTSDISDLLSPSPSSSPSSTLNESVAPTLHWDAPSLSSPFATPDDVLTASEEEEETVVPKEQFIFLAIKALWLGTVYCLVGVSLITLGIMYLCGCYSVEDVMTKVREKTQRDITLLQLKGREMTGSETVKHYEIDLKQPLQAWDQVKEIWSLALKESEIEDDEENNKKKAG